MQYNDAGFLIIAALIFFCVGATAISIHKSGKHDQPIEQITEAIIKQTTGVDMDLTPEDDNLPKS